MVQFNGKYQLDRNENFVEFIKSLGQDVKPELLEKLNNAKTVFEVEVNGDNCKFTSQSSSGPRVTSFTLGKAFEEDTIAGIKLNTTGTLEGNKITLTASMGSTTGLRIHEFSDSGLVITFTANGVTGKRYYNRL